MSRLLVEAGVVATPDGLRRDAALLIEDGRIAAIDAAAVLAGADVEQRVGGPGTLALPAFTDAHQHGRPRSTVALGVTDQPLERWLVALLGLPETDVRADTLAVARRCARSGVARTLHLAGAGGATAQEYDTNLRAVLAAYTEVGVHGIVAAEVRDRGLPVYDAPGGLPPGLDASERERVRALLPGCPPVEEALEVVAGLRAEIAAGRHGDVELVLGPPGPPWCSDALLARVAAFSAEHDVLVTTHLLESRAERAFGERAYPDGTVAGLARLGLLTERLVAAHGVWLDAADRAALAAAGATVALNPGSNLRLHAGIAPLRELLADGVALALGTDDMALSPGGDLLDELRLLRALQRTPERDGDGIGAATALRILAAGHQLVPGARADVVLVDLAALLPPTSPADPLEVALATATSAQLTAVVVGGRILDRAAGADLPLPRFRPEAIAAADALAHAARGAPGVAAEDAGEV